ncbi:MAG: 4-(cytidine 5'-diphospho)-2-C-methyl-D-erythritol kinase [Burkholderiales bacterium]|nr:4-(cytidine 5'-diphospho)-2-C-methyl-D-erythritol kinase [Burkholderiales bacterium]
MTLRALHDVPAPAKLNLFLHVVGRRDDGYHLLQSLFVLIDWADRLHFERREDGGLFRHDLRTDADTDAGIVLPADDLCLRAARALQGASGCTLGADIHLDKRLPAGAGMGGGSSDAASTLLALNRLWGLGWPRARLAALALELGADVPFFVGGENAFVEGIGERLTPVTVPELTYAVIKPPAAIETRSIFTHPLLRRDTAAVALPAILAGSSGGRDSGASSDPGDTGSGVAPACGPAHEASASARAWATEGFGRNDLQLPAEDRCPEVAEAARWLQARFGNSRMTGSGSAVFARVSLNPGTAVPRDNHGATPAPAAPPELPADLPAGWVGRMCKGLARHPLVHWAG